MSARHLHHRLRTCERTLQTVPLSKIRLDDGHPRQCYWSNSEEDKALVESVRRYGVVIQIAVAEVPQEGLLIIDGQRRWRAAKEAGLLVVPCQIYYGLTERERQVLRYCLQHDTLEGLS